MHPSKGAPRLQGLGVGLPSSLETRSAGIISKSTEMKGLPNFKGNSQNSRAPRTRGRVLSRSSGNLLARAGVGSSLLLAVWEPAGLSQLRAGSVMGDCAGFCLAPPPSDPSLYANPGE